MAHQSILAYARYRYLKLATAAVIVAVVAYAWDRPPNGRYGGTWLGYTLGTVGALLILMLLYFGVRKRRYASNAGMVQGWLSAHCYFGAALIVIVTLHAAFKVGWNVHTLAYVLMLIVIFSGFYGVYAYLRFPRVMTDNLGDDTLQMLLIRIADIDRQTRQLALSLPDTINRLVLASAQGTRIGGPWWQQLRGRDPDCPTTAASNGVQIIGASSPENRRRPITSSTCCCSRSRSSSPARGATSSSSRGSMCGCTSTCLYRSLCWSR